MVEAVAELEEAGGDDDEGEDEVEDEVVCCVAGSGLAGNGHDAEGLGECRPGPVCQCFVSC